jgi:hypothetical protein
MKEEFIPYEQALALKELGFNEPSFKAYDSKGVLQKCTSDYWDISSLNIINEATTSNLKVLAPTFSQCFKFFREKHDLDVISKPHIRKTKKYVCDPVNIRLEAKNTYEEAELECLKKLIQIIKEKL